MIALKTAVFSAIMYTEARTARANRRHSLAGSEKDGCGGGTDARCAHRLPMPCLCSIVSPAPCQPRTALQPYPAPAPALPGLHRQLLPLPLPTARFQSAGLVNVGAGGLQDSGFRVLSCSGGCSLPETAASPAPAAVTVLSQEPLHPVPLG